MTTLATAARRRFTVYVDDPEGTAEAMALVDGVARRYVTNWGAFFARWETATDIVEYLPREMAR